MGQIAGIVNNVMLFIVQLMMWSATVAFVGFSALCVVGEIPSIWGSPRQVALGGVRLMRDALPMAALAFIVCMLGTKRFHDDPMSGYITGMATMSLAMMLGPRSSRLMKRTMTRGDKLRKSQKVRHKP